MRWVRQFRRSATPSLDTGEHRTAVSAGRNRLIIYSGVVPDAPIPRDAALVRDFVNTLDIEAGTEALSGPAALGRWLADHRLPTGVPTGRDLADALALRRGLRDALRVQHDDGTPAGVGAGLALAGLDDAARGFPLRLGFPGGAPTLEPVQAGPRGGVAAVLAAAAGCGQDGTWRRLKVCSADDCQWAFYDTSRNRSRTWCAMRVCGNREKTRAYRARRRG